MFCTCSLLNHIYGGKNLQNLRRGKCIIKEYMITRTGTYPTNPVEFGLKQISIIMKEEETDIGYYGQMMV